MSSGLTLYQARTTLPTAALSAQKAATAALAAPDINAAASWLISGPAGGGDKWRGTIRQAVFTIYDEEYITLPRGMLTVQAATLQGTGDNYRQWCPFVVTNEWFQWIPGGTGFNSNPPDSTWTFNSVGDGFVFFRKLPSEGTIKITNTTTESAGSFNIRGYDSSGDKVFTGTGASRIEGENVAMPTVSGTSTTSSTVWDDGDSVYGIVKPTTNGVLLVYHVASVGGTETLIARYDPGEVNPNYRRYMVPGACITDGQVVALCKIAFVPVVVDNDQITPGNLIALEIALMAVNFRRKAEMDKATQYLQMAIDELNSEVFTFNAEQSLPTLQISPVLASNQYQDNVI